MAVRIGILGLGVGSSRAKMAAESENAELVCICDLQEDKAKARAEELGCEWTTDLDAMLGRDDIDAVGVFTSSGTHARFAMQAIDAGKHTFTTKPMDVSLDQCDALIAKAKDAGVVLGVDFGQRYSASAHQVRMALRSGAIGRIVLGDLRMKWYRPQSYYDGGWPPGWRSRLDTEGGSAANQGVHSIDLLQWLLGPVVTVQGRSGTFNHDIDTEDCSVAILTLADGGFGVIQTTTCSYPNLGTTIEVSGNTGTLTLDGTKVARYEREGEENPSLDDFEVSPDLPANIIEDMAGAIVHGRPVQVDGEEGRKSVAIFSAIYESSKTGEVITL
ncbi:Gfo/Idh/MocA family oxidoreductase [Candidatus Poribacteria bacterium]|jgi:UDP-N-acetyl-2-amino-2-deoxyglucuronate dehydrogenase|nr:Gfo/Idh/MocA family oxidoreductase [Candidatus Poribacteria bacterium]MBT5534482.1 Gfo/Idh/MocA family oxidoreductase [Candidatus Poribacteria bacterium]MBT5712961.1 Gfo/Idh/MocA family oxidoreductase [Candidatus Poribacteria bacterium]MBT7100223.1 Gfo/Idh/MocA family oxidoreductase [Candidatus Poribacteria bacterium]MBT7808442.1 Gfo/Idh/MocA family oxidoreductase [Candidatus Poribacteria bacterium]